MTRSSTVRRPADNPFSSRCVETLAFRSHDGGTDTLLERLQESGGRGAIIGPHGSGKTTLLEELARQLENEVVWIRLNIETHKAWRSAQSCLPRTVDQRHSIVIDGAEQLGVFSWWRLHRRIQRAGTILITSHLQGPVPTIYECTTSHELLKELVEELDSETTATVHLEDLYGRHGGDIRLCFRELYDRYAGRSPDSTTRS